MMQHAEMTTRVLVSEGSRSWKSDCEWETPLLSALYDMTWPFRTHDGTSAEKKEQEKDDVQSITACSLKRLRNGTNRPGVNLPT